MFRQKYPKKKCPFCGHLTQLHFEPLHEWERTKWARCPQCHKALFAKVDEGEHNNLKVINNNLNTMELDDIVKKSPEELSDEEKDFLKENKDKLAIEDQEKFEDVVGKFSEDDSAKNDREDGDE